MIQSTSKQSLKEITISGQKQKEEQRLLNAYSCNPKGLTDSEMADYLHKKESLISARRGGLNKKGYIIAPVSKSFNHVTNKTVIRWALQEYELFPKPKELTKRDKKIIDIVTENYYAVNRFPNEYIYKFVQQKLSEK